MSQDSSPVCPHQPFHQERRVQGGRHSPCLGAGKASPGLLQMLEIWNLPPLRWVTREAQQGDRGQRWPSAFEEVGSN